MSEKNCYRSVPLKFTDGRKQVFSNKKDLFTTVLKSLMKQHSTAIPSIWLYLLI
jgi:hypothetical protein